MDVARLRVILGVDGADRAEQEISQVAATTERSSGIMTSAFKKIGLALASAFAVDKIKDFAITAVKAAADIQAENAQFSASFKELSSTATEMFARVGESTGILATRLQVTGTKAFSQFKGAGIEANDALQKTETFLGLAADAAAYYDISLEDAEMRIRSFLRGNVEAGDAIGLFTSESQRNSYAVEMYGKKWIELTEAQKQNLMLKISEDIYKQSGAIGQAQREADGLQNVVGNLKEAWRQFLGVVGQPILKMVIPVIQTITGLVQDLQDKIKPLTEDISDNNEKIKSWMTTAGIAAGIALALAGAWKAGLIIGQVTKAIQASTIWTDIQAGKNAIAAAATWAWTEAQQALNTAIKSNPIGLILMAITALIGALVLLYQKNETFRNGINELWNDLKTSLIPIFEKLAPQLKELGGIFMEISNVLLSAFVPILEAIIPVLLTLAGVLTETLGASLEIVMEVINALMPVIILVTNLFAELLATLMTLVEPLLDVITPLLESVAEVLIVLTDVISTLVVPIIKLLAVTISALVKGSLPLIKGLLTVFTTVFKGIVSVIKPVIQWIGSIATKITDVVKTVKGQAGILKNLFNFKWSLPKLKVPKFSISPKGWNVGDLLKGKIPKLSVNWFAKGGIMNQPTMFDYNSLTNTASVGGEAGAEAIAPIDTLMGYVKTAVKEETGGMTYELGRILNILANYFPQILDGMDRDIVLNDSVLVGRLAPQFNSKFADIQKANERGR